MYNIVLFLPVSGTMNRQQHRTKHTIISLIPHLHHNTKKAETTKVAETLILSNQHIIPSRQFNPDVRILLYVC